MTKSAKPLLAIFNANVSHQLGRITRKDTSESRTINLIGAGDTSLSFGKIDVVDGMPRFDVKFHFTQGTKFDTMPHFHVEKTEYIYVAHGSIRLTLNGISRMVNSSAGQVEIPRWAPHRWEVLGETETVVFERTEPADGHKEAFFRNFAGLINDYGGMPPPLQAIKIFADWDNYPIGDAGWMHYVRTLIVWLTIIGGWIAGFAGYRSMYKEYTPKTLYERLR